MRQPKRPFIVEVKQRRGAPKRQRSIWGDIDLTAVAADVEAATLDTTTERASAPRPDHGSASPRVLQDVGTRPADPVPEEAAAQPTESPAAPTGEAQEKPAAQTKWKRRARRRNADDALLPRGQRWKRRLPKFLR